MSSIELREGAYYRARNGEVFGPLRHDGNPHCAWPFDLGSPTPCWTPLGRYIGASDHDLDLLEEVSDSATAQQVGSSAPDPVNHPAHYTAGGIECIDAIQAAVGPEQFKGYLRGNVLKYLWRYEHKGGVESLRKAQWYLDRLIQANA